MRTNSEKRWARSIQAVIFDMDGLMLDTERLDREHFGRAAADFGYLELEPIYLETVGRNWSDTRKHFQQVLGENFPFDELRARWRTYSKDYANKFGVPLKTGLENLLSVLDRIGIPKAVATSTQRHDALPLLETVALLNRFTVVVTGDEVSHGKPAPDIFLTAARRLSVDPKCCVVFEDSPAGIAAAHAAGMVPILVPDVVPPTDETRRIAHRVLSSLEEAVVLFTTDELHFL